MPGFGSAASFTDSSNGSANGSLMVYSPTAKFSYLTTNRSHEFAMAISARNSKYIAKLLKEDTLITELEQKIQAGCQELNVLVGGKHFGWGPFNLYSDQISEIKLGKETIRGADKELSAWRSLLNWSDENFVIQVAQLFLAHGFKDQKKNEIYQVLNCAISTHHPHLQVIKLLLSQKTQAQADAILIQYANTNNILAVLNLLKSGYLFSQEILENVLNIAITQASLQTAKQYEPLIALLLRKLSKVPTSLVAAEYKALFDAEAKRKETGKDARDEAKALYFARKQAILDAWKQKPVATEVKDTKDTKQENKDDAKQEKTLSDLHALVIHFLTKTDPDGKKAQRLAAAQLIFAILKYSSGKCEKNGVLLTVHDFIWEAKEDTKGNAVRALWHTHEFAGLLTELRKIKLETLQTQWTELEKRINKSTDPVYLGVLALQAEFIPAIPGSPRELIVAPNSPESVVREVKELKLQELKQVPADKPSLAEQFQTALQDENHAKLLELIKIEKKKRELEAHISKLNNILANGEHMGLGIYLPNQTALIPVKRRDVKPESVSIFGAQNIKDILENYHVKHAKSQDATQIAIICELLQIGLEVNSKIFKPIAKKILKQATHDANTALLSALAVHFNFTESEQKTAEVQGRKEAFDAAKALYKYLVKIETPKIKAADEKDATANKGAKKTAKVAPAKKGGEQKELKKQAATQTSGESKKQLADLLKFLQTDVFKKQKDKRKKAQRVIGILLIFYSLRIGTWKIKDVEVNALDFIRVVIADTTGKFQLFRKGRFQNKFMALLKDLVKDLHCDELKSEAVTTVDAKTETKDAKSTTSSTTVSEVKEVKGKTTASVSYEKRLAALTQQYQALKIDESLAARIKSFREELSPYYKSINQPESHELTVQQSTSYAGPTSGSTRALLMQDSSSVASSSSTTATSSATESAVVSTAAVSSATASAVVSTTSNTI